MPSSIRTGIGAEVKMATGLVPLNRAAGTENGTGFDRLGFESCVIEVSAGAEEGGPSARTLDVSLEHSDAQGSGYAAFSPAIAVAQITAVNTRKRKSVDLSGAKQYIRVVGVTGFTGGSTPKLNSAVTVVLGGAVEKAPQADD